MEVILGDIAKRNHGIRVKYNDSDPTDYKTFIDTLENKLMTAIYDINNKNDCIVQLSCPIILTQGDIDNGYGSEKYEQLENMVINYCKLHKIFLQINRGIGQINITVDMKYPFDVQYI